MDKIIEGALSIQGFCGPIDLSAHKNIIQYLKSTGRFHKSLEIGYAYGRTSYIPLSFQPEKHYIIDRYVSDESCAKDQGKENVLIIKEMTQKLSSSLIEEMSWSIDFMLIDGEHTFRGVKHDLELMAKVLSENGVAIIDDTYTYYSLHSDALSQFLTENKDFHILFKTRGQTYLCRADVHEEYYNYFLQNIPTQIAADVENQCHLAIFTGTVFNNYSSFVTAPFFQIATENETSKVVEYVGEAPYKSLGGTFPIIERRNLHYLDID